MCKRFPSRDFWSKTHLWYNNPPFQLETIIVKKESAYLKIIFKFYLDYIYDDIAYINKISPMLWVHANLMADFHFYGGTNSPPHL